MNLERLRCFIETVRYGTITEAANKLYIAQPNLSRQISLLEEELGYKVFLREHRRLKLSPAGEYLFDQLQDIPERIDFACRQAGEIAHQAKTVLNIGFLESEQLPPVLVTGFQRFQEENPHISISFQRGDFEELRQGLLNGRLDFIFTFQFEAETMANVHYRIVQYQSLVLAISATHPLARRENLTLSDLKEFPFILLNSKRSVASHNASEATFSAASFTPNIVRYTHSSEQLLLLVEIGAGATVVDENSRLQASPNVKTYPLPPTDHDPNLCLVWQQKSTPDKMRDRFVQTMTAHQEKLQQTEYDP